MTGPASETGPAAATDHDVVVIGGGVAGLAAAAECLRIGLRVLVVEEGPRVGGSVARLQIAGLTIDAGAESFATRGGHVSRALNALAVDGRSLAEEVVAPSTAGSWLHLSGGRSVPSPRAGVLGIPSVPLARDVVRAIGIAGAARAYLDRLLPLLTIGRAHSLAELVRRRMGRRVLDDLVAPVVAGVYSTRPELIDVDLASPGLNGAMTRHGSLSGAVAELRQAAPAGAAVQGIRGGMFRLVDALVERIAYLGGEVRTGARVDSLHDESGPGAEDATRWALLVDGERISTRAVVLAVPEAGARALLADTLPAVLVPAPVTDGFAEDVELVTLVIDDPRLDSAPRGSGVLVAPTATDVTAKALTHATAKWSWLAESVGRPGRHVLRLSYGRPGESQPLAGLDDAAVRSLAVADASTLLGIPLREADVVDAARVRWRNVRPAAALGHRAALDAFHEVVAEHPGLAVTGTWLAGTGLASVLPHAEAAALHIRRQLVRQGVGLPREE